MTAGFAYCSPRRAHTGTRPEPTGDNNMSATNQPGQCYDDAGVAVTLETGQRCPTEPQPPAPTVVICESGTPCPVETTTTATVAAPPIDSDLPATGLANGGLLLAVVLLAGGLLTRRAARRVPTLAD